MITDDLVLINAGGYVSPVETPEANRRAAHGLTAMAVIDMIRSAVSRRRKAGAMLGVGVLLSGLASGAAVASAADSGSDGGCPVLASAQGVMVTVMQAGHLLVGSPTGAGVPVAQACVNYAVSDSQAFASSPYPGDPVVGAPALLSGSVDNLTGSKVQSLPSYPAYAGSRHPSNEEATVNQPGLSLLARSSATASQAQASNAADPASGAATAGGVATADTSVDPAAGTSTATAKAELRPLTINGVLSLGEVVSTASATLTKARTVRRSSQLQIGRTTVAGQEVVITPSGIQAAGQTVGVPATGAEQALAQAGVTVRYLAAENTTSGIWSAGVEITTTQDPSSGAATTIHYLVGRAFATVAPVDTTPPAGDGDTGFDVTPVAGGEASTTPLDGEPASPGVPLAATAPATGTQPPAIPASTPQPQVALAGLPIDMGLASTYLVIVFGALALLVGGTLVRLLGVKTRWTS